MTYGINQKNLSINKPTTISPATPTQRRLLFAFNGNEFPVDDSISEMTLLIFRDQASQPTILIPPDSPAISAQKPRASRWRSDTGYDLITVKNPESGIWHIDADMDQDNRHSKRIETIMYLHLSNASKLSNDHQYRHDEDVHH